MKSYLVFFLFFLGAAPVMSRAQNSDYTPSKNDFVDVDKEPLPIEPIESKVVYPDAARRAGIEGKVIVSALIEKDGSVSKVEVERSDSKILETAAIHAMEATHYTPAMQGGKPIRVWVSQTISFKLNDVPAKTSENPLSGFLHMSTDSIRLVLESIGPIHESKDRDTLHLSATTTDELSHGNAPAMMSAVIGPNGPSEITLSFRHVDESDFATYRNFGGGRTVHADLSAELEDMFVKIHVDAPTRSYTMTFRKK